ncbi:MAG: hypothetical protein JWM07_907 [Candidatus Saccharibacteria bacterium]|nr:hypothetical protein [Candidatus Saccharibacteria bacterium]
MTERIDEYRQMRDPLYSDDGQEAEVEQLRLALLERDRRRDEVKRQELLQNYLNSNERRNADSPVAPQPPVYYAHDDESYYEDDRDQMQPERSQPRPSDWGASTDVDTPVDSEYFTSPPPKEKMSFPSRRTLGVLGLAAVWTGVGTHYVYNHEIDDPYSAIASLPIIGKDDPTKKELLDSLLTNCADENVGDVLYTGNISAESSIIWNVPNADGTISPLLPTRLDPGSTSERHPKAIIESAILTIGVCDTGGHPAINIRGENVSVDLSRVQSRIMLERGKAHAEGIQKERLDASVAAGAFPQETADALYAEMTNPQNIAIAVDNTLHNVGSIIAAPDSTYDKEVEAVSDEQILRKIKAQLEIKSPGVAFKIEAVNSFDDATLVGLSETETDKLAITDPKVNNAVIAIDPNAVSS